MDKELKAKWVAALRSGEYKQGRGALCNTDCNGNKSYCCLGVLADVSGDPRWDGKLFNDSNAYLKIDADTHLRMTGGALISAEAQRRLGQLNDEGVSFYEIANHIEKNL